MAVDANNAGWVVALGSHDWPCLGFRLGRVRGARSCESSLVARRVLAHEGRRAHDFSNANAHPTFIPGAERITASTAGGSVVKNSQHPRPTPEPYGEIETSPNVSIVTTVTTSPMSPMPCAQLTGYEPTAAVCATCKVESAS